MERQLRECTAKAESLGWRIARVYEDNDISAFTGKERPAYTRMLRDIEARAIDAVVVWDLDRLTRIPLENETFIALADRLNVELASVGGDFDLSTSQGRMFARMRGAIARQEIEHRSERQRAANLQRAQAVKPVTNGRRPFGYTYVGHGRDKRMVIHEEEAAHFRRAVAAIIDGGSLRGVLRDFNARGVMTTAGNAWNASQLRRALVSPRYAGVVMYRGEEFGQDDSLAIIDRDTHHAVTAILLAPERRRAGRPRRYLLSGIGRCAVCGQRLYGFWDARKEATLYQCETRQHVVRRSEPVDDHVVGVVLEVLKRRAVAPWLFAHTPTDDGDDLMALATEADSLRRRMDALAEAFADGAITAGQLKAGTQRLKASMDDLDARRAAVTRSDVLPDLLPDDDVAATWASFDIDRQRAIISELVVPRLAPPGRGAKVFNPETVTFEWKGQPMPIRLICDKDHEPTTVADLTVNGPFGWGPKTMHYDARTKTVYWEAEPDDLTRTPRDEWMTYPHKETAPDERYKFTCPVCGDNVPARHDKLQEVCARLSERGVTLLALSDLRGALSMT